MKPSRLALGVWLTIAWGSPAFAQAGPRELRWGGDKAGGAPFIYDQGGATTGFEWDLAQYLGESLRRPPRFVQVDWDNLPETLERGNIDIALNGMEFRTEWESKYPSTVPYFVFNLRLIARRTDASLRGWDDLRAAPGGHKKRVGVLRGTVAERYLETTFGGAIEIVPTREVDETFVMVEDGLRLDATVQDSPAALYFVESGRLANLHIVGEPVASGYYVILTARGRSAEEIEANTRLREELNRAIRQGFAGGTLEKIYRRYGLWDAQQERLAYAYARDWPPAAARGADSPEQPKAADHTLGSIAGQIASAAAMTAALAFCSMPCAVILGLSIALGRLYGPRLLRMPLSLYVEVLRGTPILLQLYVWFFLLPQVMKMSGWQPLIFISTMPPFVVGVFGLAINYSAYEAEIFRAGLQSIPKGQMEAALSLGMTPLTAIRRILVPQAVRVVIPAVTNDFIALFKDTSVCSMILITELTGLYYQHKYDRALVLQLAFTIGLIYLLMSYPLSLLARRLEGRLRDGKGGE